MTALGALSVGLCVLMSAFLLAVSGPLRRANRFLAGFLLLTAIDLLGWTILLFPPGWQVWFPLRLPFGYLQMPLLCAYVRALCFPGQRSRADMTGGLAAILSAISLIPRARTILSPGLSPGGSTDQFVATGLDLAGNDVALHLQFYLYLAVMAVLLMRYRARRRETDDRAGQATLYWVATLLGISFAAHMMVVAKSWAWLGDDRQAYAWLQLCTGIVAVGVNCALTFVALTRQSLFVGIDMPPAKGRGRPVVPGSEFATIDAHALERLNRYMIEQEPFLDPALTVRRLARRTGIAERDLSALLNRHLGQHFFDFVNQHRVRRASALLADPTHADKTILEIAHEAGFNSKSSFNTAFSKHCGVTPTVFRRTGATAVTG
ncbi:MAG: helix-turn-helix domain-containing protein [Candidatus Sphingomonas phytovorans]|nr:helix-turn-helix domain-containing protein [Sphingomonas sp.]WEJ99629.1 MAG: helix-turn-helix domain-containing protein [Sphingomonas sp.]